MVTPSSIRVPVLLSDLGVGETWIMLILLDIAGPQWYSSCHSFTTPKEFIYFTNFQVVLHDDTNS